MKLVSWNVNGIRAIAKKGFLEWVDAYNPDILCLQETKAWTEQVPKELESPDGYHSFWSKPSKKGYSGVAIFTTHKPKSTSLSLDIEEFDSEGRLVMAEYKDFYLFNVYFPNGRASPERLRYKLAFYDRFLEIIEEIRNQGKSVIFCGDLNTAHKAIDLTHPKANENTSGFLPVERKWMDKVMKLGYIDTFRQFNNSPEKYSWWDYKTAARSRNVGWRLDYFFVSKGLLPNLKGAFILSDIMGSDHCPVGIDLVMN
ncbi:MAG: exodeoxyribonuclease III [Thermoplasmata archaeon]|nr:exodeoxyribonuclease III [Thermoplasmata archaeon]